VSRIEKLVGKEALVFATKDGLTGEMTVIPVIRTEDTLPLDLQILIADRPPNGFPMEFKSHDVAIQRVMRAVGSLQLLGPSKAPVSLLPLARNRIEPDTLREVFNQMTRSDVSSARALGAEGLAALGDVEGLLDIERLLSQGDLELRSVAANIAEYRDLDPRGVQLLSRWIAPDQIPELRVASAAALANIHNAEAVIALGPALYDTDFQLRWRAIGALSLFANNVPVGGVTPAPGDWLFRTDDTVRFSINDESVARREAEYLSFWRQWWDENRNILEGFTLGAQR
jgi:hypothetical protein